MNERSSYLTLFLDTADFVSDLYSLQVLALAKFYEHLIHSDEPIRFAYNSALPEWRPAMPRAIALQKAPTLLGTVVIHSAVLLYGALDLYMYRVASAAFKGDTVDRTWWWMPGMVEAMTGVEPSSCAQWPSVMKLASLYQQFARAQDTAALEAATITQDAMTQYFKEVGIFAEDFERALIIANPKIKLR
jgi:hypothetical protein